MDAIHTLAAALRIRTDRTEGLAEWQVFLADRFPQIGAALERVVLDRYGLYYRWDPVAAGGEVTAAPVLLMAHYDVVPADGNGWSVSPWSGEKRDGYIHGRGALDDKLSHVAIMVAVEELVSEGWRPRRPVYLAFGGDEELGGARGARRLVEHFTSQGTRFALTLDEGAAVVRGMIPGLEGPTGLIGCAEKGSFVVDITVRSTPGHAATPPRPDVRRVIARVFRRLRDFPPDVPVTTRAFIRALGGEMRGPAGPLLRMYPFTAPLVHRVLAAQPATDAMLRSTSALTMLRASDAANVLPHSSTLSFNLRLMPGQSIETILERMRRDLRGLPVEVGLAPEADQSEAPAESPVSGRYYEAITNAIRKTWDGIPVLPYLVTSTTDSRHYARISDVIYRFVPMELRPADLDRVHGIDERIDIQSVQKAVRFYRELILDIAGET